MKEEKTIKQDVGKNLDDTIDDYELSDVEKLSDMITYILAEMAAKRFQEKVKGMSKKEINVLVRPLDCRSPKFTYGMLKMFFLVSGDKNMADILDLVNVCAEYDECAYDSFYDYFVDTDIMGWHLLESLMKEGDADVRN